MSVAEITLPEKFRRDWLIAALIFATSAIYFSCFYNFGRLDPDEGIILQGAQRILQGQVLYRDFFSFLTPGSYYWFALFFRIFGSSILVARLVLLAEGALLSVFTYLLSRRVCSRWTAFLASILVTMTGLPDRFVVLHNWDSSLWACFALYFAILFLQRPKPIYLFATGWFTAMTCLFEQTKGAGVLFGLGFGTLILMAGDPGSLANAKRKFLTALVAGFAVPLLVTFAYFSIHRALPQLLADWFWPVHHYAAVNRAPYGFLNSARESLGPMQNEPWGWRLFTAIVTGPWSIIPTLPLISVVALIYWNQKKLRTKSVQQTRAYFVVISAAVVGLLVTMLQAGRPDFSHLVYISPMLFVTLAWIMDGHMLPSFVRPALPLAVFALVVSCLGFSLAFVAPPLTAEHVLQTRRGTLKGIHPDEILAYIRRNVPAGQKIVVYPYQPLYYYLSATFSPSHFEYLMPGFHTREQFEQLVNEIDADQTRLVFSRPRFAKTYLWFSHQFRTKFFPPVILWPTT